MISTLVEATLIELDETTLPSAHWVLELMDEKSSLEQDTGIAISSDDILSFQVKVAKPFLELLKCYISNHFSFSGDKVRAMSIFDPQKPRTPFKVMMKITFIHFWIIMEHRK